MTAYDTVADRVRRARRRAGYTTAALATAAGLSHDTVARIERGERQGSYQTLAAIARTCQVPYETLDPDLRARGNATHLLRHWLDEAGPDGIERRSISRRCGQRFMYAAAIDAALAPLLASGDYEQIQVPVPAGRRVKTIYRRVQAEAQAIS